MAELRAIAGGRSTSERITLPRYALSEAAIEAQVAVGDIDRQLARIYALCWAQKRIKALLAISDLQADLASARRAFQAIAGLAEEADSEPPTVTERPAGPRRAPARRRRDRVVGPARAA